MLTGEQIERRTAGVGGSDAAVIAGLSSFMTARELFHVKRGELDPASMESDPLIRLGHGIEPVLAKLYTEETGRKVHNVNITQEHPDLDWMIAHPDRRIVADGVRRGLEIKMRVHGEGWGPPGTDQIPDDVLLQVQHYMEVTGFDLWDVIVLIGGSTIRIYTVPRDREMGARLIDIEGEFMHRIATDNPPDLDFEHRTTQRLITALHPHTDGRIVQLSHEANAWREVMADAELHRKRYADVERAAKNHILDLMGDASVGMLPDGSMFKRAERSTTRANGERSKYIALTYKQPRK